MKPQRMGHPNFLGSEVFCVLDCADFDVGLAAGFVAAEAGDPYLTVADHGPFGVDEKVFVLLFEDGVLNVVSDDTVVIVDEGLLVFDDEGPVAGVDLDWIVDEGGDCRGVVFGDGLLEGEEDLLDFSVVADGEIDGFVVVGWGDGLGCGKAKGQEGGGGKEGGRDMSAEGHSFSCRRFGVVPRIAYTSRGETLSVLYG